MFHVEGPLGGGGKYEDTPLNDEEGMSFSTWRLVVEKAGTIPQAMQVYFSLLLSLYFHLFLW